MATGIFCAMVFAFRWFMIEPAKSPTRVVRVVCIGDTHGKHEQVEVATEDV